MHAQQHAKNHFKFFKASDQAELRPNPCRTRHQAGPWCTQLQILLSACQISKFQNFHNFLNFYQPKGCFLSDRQKSPEFYPIKKVFFSKRVQLYKKKNWVTVPASTTDPKKVKKVDFDFFNRPDRVENRDQARIRKTKIAFPPRISTKFRPIQH